MLDRLVKARRIARHPKNFIKGRKLIKKKELNDSLTNLLETKYDKGREISLFAIDTNNYFSNLKTNNPAVFKQAISLLEKDYEQTKLVYQEFQGKNSSAHYYDVNYKNHSSTLKVIIKYVKNEK
ncbi:hypothetical protein CMO90_03940 [Candidatus Woesearchaeota archaeon]|jgi:hypothetical protein|nr:hypothetical protein [Candidatus Woesearchaeota archaeon]|tara:strand:- start:568 stop:939 length:372 start_codon:yes stop_codon:yes gene_type:complete